MSAAISKQPLKAVADSRYLTERSDIIACLKQLRDTNSTLQLQLKQNAKLLTCRLLDLNERGFLIEDVKPRDAIAELKARPEFSLSARGNGSYVFVESLRVQSVGEELGLPYFLVPFPNKVLSQQRRQAIRYNLPQRVRSAGATFSVFSPATVIGKIIDLSVGGCRVAFPADQNARFKIDQRLSNCAINLPSIADVHSESVVRHCHTNKDGQLVCGLELVEMQILDRRRLEHYVRNLSKLSS